MKLWGMLGLVAVAATTYGASSPESGRELDHSEWQALLGVYLITDDPSGVNLVDYAKWKVSDADRARLESYIEYLEGVDPAQHPRDVQMAFWINLYNAVTVRLVVDAYPVESIRNIRDGLLPFGGPWGDVRTEVAGEPLTLDNIEHDILRAEWQDNRVHYAVNCASMGCPDLMPEAYTAANLERLLDHGARDYVNHSRGAEFLDDDRIVVSSIYDWYREDFGDSEAGVLDHLRKYAEGELAERLRGFDGSIDHRYDWSLNEPSGR